MKRSRFVLIFIALAVLLALSGCINFKEEFWFNADGSGKMSIDIGMSQSLLDLAKGSGGTDPFADLKKEYETTNPLVKNVTSRQYSDKVNGQDMQHYAVTFEVTDMQKYIGEQAKTSDGSLEITLKKLDNGNFSYSQKLNMSGSSGLPSSSGLDAKSLESFLKDMNWTVTVHAPTVVSADKTAKVSGGTAEWTIPMTQILSAKTPIELSMEFSPKGGGDFPSWIIFVIIGVVVVAAIVVAVLLILKRRKPAPAYDPSAYGYPPYDPNAPLPPQQPEQPQYPPQQPPQQPGGQP